ncbi:MAG: putative baseplate assembly protein [Anaerolineae bacterium]|nr:putative baseplate assembly protein [Anaerolineae bacterium]
MISLSDEPTFLHFQKLVDQARKSIFTYCPEWTDYNVSDPGIMLIELFAAMTAQLDYRLHRIPERNLLKFLKLLGVTPDPPQPAETNLTFYLITPFPLIRANGQLDYVTTTKIPVNTEVAVPRATGAEPEIIFVTETERVIAAPRLMHVRRDFQGRDINQQFSDNCLKPISTNEGIIYELKQGGFEAFQPTPQPGDTFYVGFNEQQNIAGYILQLNLNCAYARGTGIISDSPPLIWEYSLGDQPWKSIEAEEDTTKGLNENGYTRFRLPLDLQPTSVRGVRAYWLRCRYEIKDETKQGRYEKTPQINDLKAFVLGITLPAIHSTLVEGEELGESNGEPGQRFRLSRQPVLPFEEARQEVVTVDEEKPTGILMVEWKKVADFTHSGPYDRHFSLDLSSGEICFGPTIRQSDGTICQYGAIPKLGHKIRVTRYRTGGGVEGNVPAGSLRVLKKPISYIHEVTNRSQAIGGKDPEPPEAAIFKAKERLQGRQRAVTAEDYEYLCQQIDGVARVKCLEPGSGQINLGPGMVKLLVVPRVNMTTLLDDSKIDHQSSRATSLLTKLKLDDDLKRQLRGELEPTRLLGITLTIGEPTYLGVKVAAEIQRERSVSTQEVKEKIIKALEDYLAPLLKLNEPAQLGNGHSLAEGGSYRQVLAGSNGAFSNSTITATSGWSFGQNLYISDIYARLKAVPGVNHVTKVKLWWREYDLNDLGSLPDWTCAENDFVPVPPDGLVCLDDDKDTFEGIKVF